MKIATRMVANRAPAVKILRVSDPVTVCEAELTTEKPISTKRMLDDAPRTRGENWTDEEEVTLVQAYKSELSTLEDEKVVKRAKVEVSAS